MKLHAFYYLAYELSNEKPVLQIGDKKRRLGSSELHGFPYCVSCEGSMLKLSVHHGITDGYGTTEFVKTLLYYYLQECGKPVTADGEIRLLEAPYDEKAEDEMSYLKYYDKTIKPEQPQLGDVKLFALPVEYWDEAGRYEFKRFKLSLSAKQVVGSARECGSSATGLINAIICKAFQKAYDLEGRLLINSLTSNFRRLLPSDSMHNFSGWFLTFYTPEMQKLPLAQTAAVMKGMIAQNNTEQNALKVIAERSVLGLKQREMSLDEIFADKPDCLIEKKAVRQSMGSIITNVGSLGVTESMKPWIKDVVLKNVNYNYSESKSNLTNDAAQESIFDKILEFCVIPKSTKEICEHLGYKNLTYFSRHFLKPLIEQGKLKLTIPDKPNSKMQKYVSE